MRKGIVDSRTTSASPRVVQTGFQFRSAKHQVQIAAVMAATVDSAIVGSGVNSGEVFTQQHFDSPSVPPGQVQPVSYRVPLRSCRRVPIESHRQPQSRAGSLIQNGIRPASFAAHTIVNHAADRRRRLSLS